MLKIRTTKLLLLGLVGATMSAFAAESVPVEGTWLVTITPAQPPSGFPASFTALETYSEGGGMVTTNALPPVPRPGQGAWVRNGSDCRATIIFLGVDLGTAAAGSARIDHTFMLNGKDEYSGSGTARFFDSAGNLLFSISFTSQGRRISVP